MLTWLAVIYLRGHRPGGPRHSHPGRRPRLPVHPPAAASCPADGTAGRGPAIPGQRTPRLRHWTDRIPLADRAVVQFRTIIGEHLLRYGLQNALRVVPRSSRGGRGSPVLDPRLRNGRPDE